MDLAGGHVLCLDHIDRDEIFKTPTSFGGSFGGSGGKYRAFNVSQEFTAHQRKMQLIVFAQSSERARVCPL